MYRIRAKQRLPTSNLTDKTPLSIPHSWGTNTPHSWGMNAPHSWGMRAPHSWGTKDIII
ncbi:hypothetical protein [Prevotella intermedia]|uniref:hypothetical protein n=1 Tax=Prevotella intermedia TaxID=28131 RepID=UPI0012FDB32B|nr:hypothetical protein [Prevotella intermedia]